MAFVKTEVQGAVEIITIDRPKALNALNPEVLADLKAAFEAVDQSAIRCIVLTGEGDKSFVAGADIGSMSTMTKAEGEAFGKLGNDVFLMVESFPIPVIAAVNGFALGGGNELRYPHLLRQRCLRPAGSRSGHHPGLRRHPASGTSGRHGHGKAAGLLCTEHQG